VPIRWIDQLQEKDRVETLLRSLSRFSEKVLPVLLGKSDVSASSKKIGPALIFERLWEELGTKKVIKDLLSHRNFAFDVERAIFLTVPHRLFVAGSDRSCEKWSRAYKIKAVESLSLLAFIGPWPFLVNREKTKGMLRLFFPGVPKTLLKKAFFYKVVICSPDLTWSASIPPPSVLKEKVDRVSVKKGTVRITARISIRWLWGAFIDNKGKPVCCEMGREIQLMSEPLFLW
jgi:hypothetical protein